MLRFHEASCHSTVISVLGLHSSNAGLIPSWRSEVITLLTDELNFLDNREPNFPLISYMHLWRKHKIFRKGENFPWRVDAQKSAVLKTVGTRTNHPLRTLCVFIFLILLWEKIWNVSKASISKLHQKEGMHMYIYLWYLLNKQYLFIY